MLRKSTRARGSTRRRLLKEEAARRIGECLQEKFIFKTCNVWIVFDIQSGCVKAAAVIGTRNPGERRIETPRMKTQSEQKALERKWLLI